MCTDEAPESVSVDDLPHIGHSRPDVALIVRPGAHALEPDVCKIAAKTTVTKVAVAIATAALTSCVDAELSLRTEAKEAEIFKSQFQVCLLRFDLLKLLY